MQTFKITFISNVIKRSLVYTRQRCYSSVHTGQTSALTSCEDLHQKLQNEEWHKKLRILDARCNVEPLDYQAMHMENRIQGSKFFSFAECRDKTSDFPVMLPSSNEFSAYVTSLGITNQHHVVVYDDDESLGAFFSPRVWWMFRAFGHENVSILDGGFGKWCLDGYPTISGEYNKDETLPKPAQPFKTVDEPKYYVTFEQMKRNIESENPTQLVDTRLLDEFSAGHIPSAKMTPFTDFFNKDKTMKSKNDLLELFRSSKVDIESDIIATCQIGVTAALAAHALFHVNGKEIPVYDGSFAEWAERAPELVSRD